MIIYVGPFTWKSACTLIVVSSLYRTFNINKIFCVFKKKKKDMCYFLSSHVMGEISNPNTIIHLALYREHFPP